MTKSKKKNKISLTKVRQILKSCVFDSLEAGKWKIIADVDNVEYFLGRAKEEIGHFEWIKMDLNHIKMAIQLLVLAYIKSESYIKENE